MVIPVKIRDNYSHYGGGIYASDGSDNSIIYLTNSTIVNNRASSTGYGSGLYVSGVSINMNNCIFKNHDREIYFSGTDTHHIGYCSIEGGSDGVYGTVSYVNGSFYATCSNVDPKFVNPTITYGTGGITANGNPPDWQLQVVSPCLNAGTPDIAALNLPFTDISGNPRVTGSYIDMGANELLEYFDLPIPTNLEAFIQDDDVVLTWSEASQSPIGYNIYRDYVLIADTVSGTTYTDSMLATGIYLYQVTALHSTGESWPAGPTEAVVGDCHGGIIDEPVTWGPGEINVCVDIIVANGGTLTLLPGTKLLFQSLHKIDVIGTGKIIAQGTATDSIYLTVADTTGAYNWTHTGWAGLRFGRLEAMNSAADSSKFSYCCFEYGKSDNGGAFHVNSFDKLLIENNTFRHNYASSDGGALFLYGSNIKIVNSIISENKTAAGSGDVGGGIYFYGTSNKNMHIINCLVSNNYAYYGEGIFTSASTINSIIYLTNSTIVNNIGSLTGDGSGIEISGVPLYMNNCILKNHDWEVFFSGSATRQIGYCIIDGGVGGIYGSATYVNGSFNATCTDLDPKFVNPTTNYGTGGITANGNPPDWQLHVISPCLDVGTPDITGLNLPEKDIAGNPRIFDNERIDMGAYELQATVHKLELPKGWSGVSSFIVPHEIATESIFSPVVDELVILQNFEGMYWPYAGVNTIPEWNDQGGYQIKMDSSQQLYFAGTRQDSLTLSLSVGWNYLPVLNSCINQSSELFSQIANKFEMVKEIAGGKVYWPQFNINTLDEIIPGKAYFILMNEDDELVFPICDGLKNAMKAQLDSPAIWKNDLEKTVPWSLTKPTALSHIIAIPESVSSGINQGNLIGAFDLSDHCYGFSVLESDAISLSVFSDDPYTPEKDGFYEGEKIFFKRYDPVTKTEMNLSVEFDPSLLDYDGTFKINGLSAIHSLKVSSTSLQEPDFENIRIYPNPAIEQLTVSFGKNCNAEINVLNIHGQKLLTYSCVGQEALLDVTGLPVGLNLIEITTSGFKTIKRFIKN